jgi:SAM-dependent methyltransferase
MVERKRKRSLSRVGGPVERIGDPAAAARLAHALDVEPNAGLDRWTHGFHTWPARMHPDTAARLAAFLARPGDPVLDPFCGGGTVLLEALVAGARPTGRDLNPLAVRLARLRCARTSETQRRALRDAAHRIAGHAAGRARMGALPGDDDDPDRSPDAGDGPFDGRTRLQLAWIRALLRAERDPFARETLELVLSSILVKVSCRASDTDPRELPRCNPPGAAASIFLHRADELSRRLKDLARRLAAPAPPPDLAVDDARTLRTVPDGSIAAVITSPPYPNVYDYADQHALRAAWLGIDGAAFERDEIGSRRSFRDPRRGLQRWEDDGKAWTAAIARVLRPGGRAAILGGDGATPLGPVRFDEHLARWARAGGLETVASAAQRRPPTDAESRRAFRDAPRREHLVLLRKP